MNQEPRVDFRQAALASGLVSREQLEEAEQLLRQRAENQSVPVVEIPQEELAQALVQLGYLNAWQADQLLKGRTKWTLGPYRILDAIGQGGMGQVFKAEHTLMRRVVAIKVLPLERSTPQAIADFQREIQAQAQLDHENLVRAYDAGQDGSVYYLVTEYVPGWDLRRLVKKRGRLNMYAAAAVITQVAQALDYAHRQGFVHRDVKPGNVLVTPEGVCKLSDLGLAGHVDELCEPGSHRIVGTIDYLAPEQIVAPEKIGPPTDIYALGCTLYYAVTGKVPFPGGTPRDKARAHCSEQPLDPRRLNSMLDDEFVDLIADMMMKDPAARVQSAAEVIRRLRPWAGDDPVKTAAIALQGGTPPVRRTTTALASVSPEVLNQLADVRPLPEVAPPVETPSQLSQGTVPVASATEETFPAEWPPLAHQFQSREPLPKSIKWLITISIVAVILTVVGMVVLSLL